MQRNSWVRNPDAMPVNKSVFIMSMMSLITIRLTIDEKKLYDEL